MTEFIIVGQGLAAHTLMHRFHRQGISFHAVGLPELSNCSRIAAGIWNPVVFKRMTKSWLADALIAELNTFYTDCEQRMQTRLITQRLLIKPFTEEQEKALWKKKAGLELRLYLDEEPDTDPSQPLTHCRITNGYGLVKHCGNLNLPAFLDASAHYFKDQVTVERFDHAQLQVLEDKVVYKNRSAKHIIFCEGYLVKDNPYFHWIPLKPAKGELLTLHLPGLQLKNTIFNKNGFLMDLGAGLYRMGATYAWDDLSEQPTAAACQGLETRLQHMIDCGYSIQKHEAGIRPSALDRRPLMGRHPKHRHLFVFNGLGTKGVMLAPFFANNFVNFYLQKEAIHPEADLSRFYSLYET